MKFLFTLVFFLCFGNVFADEPRSALDNEPSVDTAAPAAAALSAPDVASRPAPAKSAADNVEADTEEPPELSPDGQSSYVYDLKKLIIKSRENIKRVNEKIKEQAVVKRNQKREERAREYYERGLQLTEEGKLDQAREYFDKAIRLTEHPEMMRYIQKSEFRLKAQEKAMRREQRQQELMKEVDQRSRQVEAQQVYDEAVRLYREKKYKEARDRFDRVEELAPDYKATRSYLRIIDQDIVQNDFQVHKEQKVEMQRQEKEAEEARQREKTVWRQELERKEKERRKQVNEQADTVYNEATRLYKEKKFADAKKKFQEVEWVVPDYKATRNYLGQIDKDVEDEEKRVAAQKEKDLEQQRWEEEVERSKKELLERQAAEEEEKKRQKQLQDESGFLYQGAVALYEKGELDEAEDKFKEIEKILPNYKATRVYIAKVGQARILKKKREQEMAAMEAKRQADLQAKAERERQEAEAKEARRKTEEETEKLYSQGIELYSLQDFTSAKEKFTQASQLTPGYKKLKDYLRRIDNDIRQQQAAKAKKQEPPPPSGPPASSEKPAVRMITTAEEKQQAKDIYELAQKSSELYQKIAALADDRRILPVKRKMAQIDDILNHLKAQKEKILRQIHEEEEKQRQRELKEQQERMMAEVADIYDEAILLLRNHEHDQAKAKFNQVDKTIANFKNTRRYLALLESDTAQAEREAMLERTRGEEKQFHELAEKKRQEEQARRVAEEERLRKLKEAQEAEIQSLAEKAGLINDDVLAASKLNDFATVKTKFAELEKILESLLEIKKAMLEQEQKLEEQRQAQQQADKKRQEDLRKREALQLKSRKLLKKSQSDSAPPKGMADTAIEQAEILEEKEAALRQKLEKQVEAGSAAEELRLAKRKDAMSERQALFRQAAGLYDQKKYTAAKVIFEELAVENYPGAKAYADKIDRLMGVKEAKVKASLERQRSEFLAEQIRQQRLSRIMQEKERLHQRALIRALEKQRHAEEDDRQRERIRQEAFRLKERENRRRQKARGKPAADDASQFRKLPPQGEKVKREPAKPKAKPEAAHAAPKPEAVEFKQADSMRSPEPVEDEAAKKKREDEERQAQVEYSNQRKKFLEDQYNKEQQEKQMEAQRLAQEQRKEQEAKRRMELKAEQQRLAEEKEKKIELEREAKERQKKLEAERRVIRQQLIKGAEDIYRDALRLYKAKDYAASAQKFQDIEDILPDFKQTRSYLEKIRRIQSILPAVGPAVSNDMGARDRSISQTLDVFNLDVQ